MNKRHQKRPSPLQLHESSFSRFVFPFAWRLEPWPEGGGCHIWQPLNEKEAPGPGKRKYFTQEIGKALYDRALWLKLSCFEKNPWAEGQPICLPSGRRIRAVMSPPRMVLFEYELAESDHELLKSGFLWMDIRLEKEAGSKSTPTLDDLLLFNERFRFFDQPYAGHYLDSGGFRSLFQLTRSSFLQADASRVEEQPATAALDHYYDRWAELLKQPLVIEGKRYRLIQTGAKEATRQQLLTGQPQEGSFLVYDDNRAYTWSTAAFARKAGGLHALAASSSNRASDYGHWIRFLNVDPPAKTPTASHHVSNFERQWAEKRTYHRWEESGTWYGFTYHSGVMLQNRMQELSGELNKHFSNIYFDIALLLFYLRVTLFRFSSQLGQLAPQLLEEKDVNHHLRALNRQFSYFTIRYQFPLLSNQQQAIELYELIRAQFDINDLYEEVKAEIHETHQQLETLENNQLTKAANRISRVGLPLAAGAFAAGLFGMNIDDFHFFRCLPFTSGSCGGINWEAVMVFIVMGLSAMALYGLAHRWGDLHHRSGHSWLKRGVAYFRRQLDSDRESP